MTTFSRATEMDSLADRIWYAYNCLPRDTDGKLPSYRQLEIAYALPSGMLCRAINGTRTTFESNTILKVAEALRCEAQFFLNGGGTQPFLPPGQIVPPRPGTGWKVHGDIPDWDLAMAIAKQKAKRLLPPEAFLAGADMPLYRQILRVTPDLVIWVSGYAWETCNALQQKRYSTLDARTASAGQLPRARPLRRPAVK